jgi:CubicO group peptidase (beta-lactamase class C family)
MIRDRLRQSLVTRPGNSETVVRVGAESPAEFPFESIWDPVVKVYETGLHPAIALCVRHKGEVVLDRTIGHVDNPPGAEEPGEVATPDTLFSLFSASKVMTAMVVHALVEDGTLDLHCPVAAYLPEFDRHGKGNIRLRHLLNHTAGIPNVPTDLDPDAFLESGRMPMASLAGLVPSSPPGQRVAYHPMTSWLLISEIVERVTGRDLREHLVERFLAPLGFAHLSYGVSPDDIPRVAKHATTGPPSPGMMIRIFQRTIGVDPSLVEKTNEPRFLTGLHPSANIIGTARETTRFLQMLLNGGELDGVRVLKEETILRAVTEVTHTQSDGTFLFPMRYGLGLMMGGDRFSLFGFGTPGAFGHIGFSNVVVYADPRRDLAVAFLNSGKPMMAPGMLRWVWALQRIVSMVQPTPASPNGAVTADARK